MPVYDFTWRGQSAHDVYGIDTMRIGSTVIAQRRDDAQPVPGRSGMVHSQDGAVEEIERQLTIYLPYDQGRTVADFAEIRSWLRGYGQLTLSTIPGRYMTAYITDQIALDPVVDGYDDLKGIVIFRCDPYLYHTVNDAITPTQGTVVTNPGTAEARPVITISASGDINLMIGGKAVLLTGLDGTIIIDSVIEEAYALSGSTKVNRNAKMSGDFPLLPTGSVTIDYTLGDGSTLTGLSIVPNWRDIN